MDRLSKERRSYLMSRVRSKNTTPEIKVRSLIHRLGYRFRLHYKKLPGTPDLAFPKRKKVIFVHGCFWHGHEGCNKGRLPKSNLDVWETKIERNRERDKSHNVKIKSLGWHILVVWQCEIVRFEELVRKVQAFLEEN